MENKHTPGPWETVPVGDGPEKMAIAHSGVSILTVVQEGDTPFGAIFKESDARLIAAAPELMEACENLLSDYCRLCVNSDEMNCDVDDRCSVVAKAEAAIAKVKGEG